VSITWFNPKAQKLSIDIKDMNGNAIHSFNETQYNQGINNITWTPDAKIAGGSYFVVVSDGFNNVSEKIIYIK
jgi:flagellar hook assembly protein FlgD